MSEQRIAEVFVELADILVDDFDVVDFLHSLTERCVELLAVDAALLAQRGAALARHAHGIGAARRKRIHTWIPDP